MVTVNDLNELDGVEIRPGVTLIGPPGFHEESRKWRCLANAFGTLCLVELKLTVLPKLKASKGEIR
jgi:hypothetical protein